jgi:hypothetical protein
VLQRVSGEGVPVPVVEPVGLGLGAVRVVETGADGVAAGMVGDGEEGAGAVVEEPRNTPSPPHTRWLEAIR